jgi:predicted aminopeptidase
VRRAVVAIALAVGCTALGGGCLMTRYLAQGAHGQAYLLGHTRPIADVVRDDEVDLRTRMLLAEIPEIKAYGAAHGLDTRKNYNTFVDLPRNAAVWFVGAADPLKFKPLKWCFPIVGCFAGLGWFDEDDALQHRKEMEAAGYDVIARPASAYSTGGWLPDPVLSTMLSDDDDAFPELANVILHESVHATVLVPDQPFFNESFAEYVADVMTDAWVIELFGEGSPEQVTWLLSQAVRRARTSRLVAAHEALETVYDSDRPRAEKLAAKKRIIDELVDDLHAVRRPNNASLIELQVYQAGGSAHARAHRACGDLRSLLDAARTLTRKDFMKDLQEDLAPIADTIAARCAARAGKPAAAPGKPTAPVAAPR